MISFENLTGYIRPRHETGVEIIDIEEYANGGSPRGTVFGRLVNRPNAPGWFASLTNGGVVKNRRDEVMYFDSSMDALEYVAGLRSWISAG